MAVEVRRAAARLARAVARVLLPLGRWDGGVGAMMGVCGGLVGSERVSRFR